MTTLGEAAADLPMTTLREPAVDLPMTTLREPAKVVEREIEARAEVKDDAEAVGADVIDSLVDKLDGPDDALDETFVQPLDDKLLILMKDKKGAREVLVSPFQLSNTFGTGFVKFVVEFLVSMSQMTAFYGSNRIAINLSMLRYVRPVVRKTLGKVLRTMHRFMHPIMLAWSEFASNDDVDRYGTKMDELISTCMAVTRKVCGRDNHFPNCFSAVEFNTLSDSVDDRNLAFSVARVGSYMLMIRVVILRICSLLLDFHKLNFHLHERSPHFTLPHACCPDNFLKSVSCLSYPDPEMLRPPQMNASTATRPLSTSIDSTRASHIIKACVFACDRQLVKFSEAPPTSKRHIKSFLVIGDEEHWVDEKLPRYNEKRWERIKASKGERSLWGME
jgi:hypothetical protein